MKSSRPFLQRLPHYLAYLKTYPKDRISSRELAQALGLGEVLVRKDLAAVSNGGQRKIGHCCERLIYDIEHFLDFDNLTDAVLVGAGNLGQALLGYSGFEHSGVKIISAFDTAVTSRRKVKGKPLYPMSRLYWYCRQNQIRLGIIAVPSNQAQAVCDELIEAGVMAIWNFTPIHLRVSDDVLIRNENLEASLAALRVRLEARCKEHSYVG